MATTTPSAGRQRSGVMASDIRFKTCWICAEEESEEVLPTSSWIHPCSCTMVAHRDCLAQWIAIERRKAGPAGRRDISCPSCKTDYLLYEPKPALLRVLEAGERIISFLVPVGAASILGTGVLVASTAYACVALRLLLGSKASGRMLSMPWPLRHYLNLPLLPWALIASRLPFLETASLWVPTLLALPATHFPLTRGPWAMLGLYGRHDLLINSRTYPPTPAMMVIAIPWVRVLYSSIKHRIFRLVLAQSPRLSRRRVGRRRRVIILGDDNMVDANAPAGVDAIEEQVQPGAVAGQQDVLETVYISPQSIARLSLGALCFPAICAAAGGALGRLARHSQNLASFLGMDKIELSKSSSSVMTQAPVSRMFRRGPKEESGQVYGGNRSFFTTYTDDLDPVWYRNLLGGALVIVAKDAIRLLFQYLQQRQKGKLTIVDRPFDERLVAGLDLRDSTTGR